MDYGDIRVNKGNSQLKIKNKVSFFSECSKFEMNGDIF